MLIGLPALPLFLAACACRLPAGPEEHLRTVVFQSDFGLSDGAVSAMKGVAHQVDSRLRLEDLTHAIEPFNVWEGAYRLNQTAAYWPADTVFVLVVDPGVGTARRSIVARAHTGHLFVTPDNGTLTFIAESLGIESARRIDESGLRLPGSRASLTFHGRDVYSYVGALLAAGKMSFEEVGLPLDPKSLVRLPYRRLVVEHLPDGVRWKGTVPVLDPKFGNVWTDIPTDRLRTTDLAWGNTLDIRIFHEEEVVFEGTLPYVETFGRVDKSQPLAYQNSLGNLSFAINQGSFAERFGIGFGNTWYVEVCQNSL
jgi:S-adenosylmethionine hydrolase